MGTRPRPRQAAAAAAGGDGAWEARTGPRQTQTCSDTPGSVEAKVTEDASWGREEHVFLWTQELVSTVDTTLASVATNHVGVKKNAQRAAERGGSQDWKLFK